MKIAIIYLEMPDTIEPVALGIAFVLKGVADLKNATHLVRQVSAWEKTKADGMSIFQKAVAIALTAAGYEVVNCSERIVVDIERRSPS